MSMETVYAWVVEEPDGTEGIIGANIGPGGSWLPLVSSRREAIERLRLIALNHAKGTGKPVRMVEFSQRKVIREGAE